jgi:hypothetical protein
MVSVACVLKFKGIMKKANEKANLPEQTTEGTINNREYFNRV